MDDAYVVGDADGLTPLQAEIRDAVARELHAQFALRADSTKDRHAVGEKVSTAPARSLESRTCNRPGRLSATSTHAPLLLPLRVDLRHRAPVRRR